MADYNMSDLVKARQKALEADDQEAVDGLTAVIFRDFGFVPYDSGDDIEGQGPNFVERMRQGYGENLEGLDRARQPMTGGSAPAYLADAGLLGGGAELAYGLEAGRGLISGEDPDIAARNRSVAYARAQNAIGSQSEDMGGLRDFLARGAIGTVALGPLGAAGTSRGALFSHGAKLGAVGGALGTDGDLVDRTVGAGVGALTGGALNVALPELAGAVNKRVLSMLSAHPEFVDKVRGTLARAGALGNAPSRYMPRSNTPVVTNEAGQVTKSSAATGAVRAVADALNSIGDDISNPARIRSPDLIKKAMRNLPDVDRAFYRQTFMDALETQIKDGKLATAPTAAVKKLEKAVQEVFRGTGKGGEAIGYLRSQVKLAKSPPTQHGLGTLQVGRQGGSQRLLAALRLGDHAPNPTSGFTNPRTGLIPPQMIPQLTGLLSPAATGQMTGPAPAQIFGHLFHEGQ